MNPSFQLDNVVAPTSDVDFDRAEYDAVSVPPEFICPITLQIMACPVMTRAGVNYERSAIIAWLQNGSGVCPLTRTPLVPNHIVANIKLENKIRHWCRVNAVELKFDMTDLDKAGFVGFVPLNENKHKKILKRLEQRIHETESGGVVQPRRHCNRNRSLRQSSQRQRQSSSSGRSERLRSTEFGSAASASTYDTSERLLNLRNIVAVAKRAVAA
jgi:hypothetical protein